MYNIEIRRAAKQNDKIAIVNEGTIKCSVSQSSKSIMPENTKTATAETPRNNLRFVIECAF